MSRDSSSILAVVLGVAVLSMCASGCAGDTPDPGPQSDPAPATTPGAATTTGADPVVSPEPDPAASASVAEREALDQSGSLLGLKTPAGHVVRASRLKDGVRVRIQPVSGTEPGRIVARLLAPDDAVVAEATGKSNGDAEVHLDLKGPDVTGAGWAVHRLETEIGTDDRLLASLQRFQRSLSLRVLAPDKLLAGGALSPRVIVTSAGKPVEGAAVSLTLGGTEILKSTTGPDGQVVGTATVPENAESGQLTFAARKGDASDQVQARVEVRRQHRILLTTDKPLYQPGQTMHLRALTMKRPSLVPYRFAPTTFEIYDGKGNKVFRKKVNGSEHGVAAITFQLASEVNMGAYRIRATVDGNETVRAVDVSRYVLPRFKVSATPERTYYLVGQTIEGTVDAQYFFGKPVAGKVTIELETLDVSWSRAATAEGQLDARGLWSFAIKLPDTLVGQPLQRGQAAARINVLVTDSAGQTESRTVPIPVSSEPLRADVIVSGGRLIPGILNDILVVVSRPDGKPVPGATVTVKYDEEVSTGTANEAGLAGLVVSGTQKSTLDLTVSAPSGAILQKHLGFRLDQSKTSILLAVANPLAKVGDSLRGHIRASGGLDRVFVDVIRDGQPIASMTTPLTDGEAELEFPLTADHAGTLLIQAWHVGKDMQIVRDARPVVVTHADGLRVSLEKTPGQTYRPGEVAKLTLAVTDARNQPVPAAALGVRIVDEALLALAQTRAGLASLFFALEEELMKPRLQVHAFSVADLSDADRAPIAARVLSAASDASWQPKVVIDTQKQRVDAIQAAFSERILSDAEAVHAALKDPRSDPWGTSYRVDEVAGSDGPSIRSAGPDEAFETPDDVVITFEVIQAQRRRRLKVLQAALVTAVQDKGVMEGGAAPLSFGATGSAGPGGSGGEGVRVRQFFPETLYVNPLVIADGDGKATIEVTMADSITTWRLTSTASDAAGRLGSGAAGVVVFQDFFVDVSLPESVTRNDEIEVPLVVYNYRQDDESVVLTPELGDGFERLDGTEPLTVALLAGEVKSVSLRVRARRAGAHAITVHARGSETEDAVRRTVRVIPDGRAVTVNQNGVLDGKASVAFEIPKQAIPGGNTVLVKLYPGRFSQVVEGLDSMLRMPSGCFEQTSSTTYPNVLALSYLRGKKQVTPELEIKALSYINQGWQRLLTYEVDGGGFSWFGDQPANKVLTAFGVQEFADMSRVYAIDEAVLTRTQAWLASQQEPDGSWQPDAGHLHAENWGDLQKGSLLVTAYIARALAVSGYKGESLTQALNWLDGRWSQAKDPYSLALIGGAMAASEPDSATTREVLGALAALAKKSEDNKTAHWAPGVRTAVYGNGLTANIETTALAAHAFMLARQHMDLVQPSLRWLIEQKDPSGTWHATMPTILALTALVRALTDSSAPAEGTANVALDGKTVATWTLTKEDGDVLRQVDLSDKVRGKHRVSVTLDGTGNPMYQVVARHHLAQAPPEAAPAFEMAVTWDKTKLASQEIVQATATVISRLPVKSKMLLLDLAVPPGFEVLRQDLDSAVAKERIEKYRIAGRSIIVYLEELGPGEVFELNFRLKATVAVKAMSGVSRVYEYYAPAKKGEAPATLMTVDG